MRDLKYAGNPGYFEGIIVRIEDGLVGIDMKGRLGHFTMPKRMLITDYEIELGLEVGFIMSYPEVLDREKNEKYLYNIEKDKNRNKEVK